MTSISVEDLIEKIKAKESNEKCQDLRYLSSNSIIRTTKEVSAPQQKRRNILENSIDIKRNLRLDLALWVFAGLLIVFPIEYIIAKELLNKRGNFIGIAFGIGFLFFFLLIAYKNLTLKKFILPIYLTEKYIRIIGNTFQWNEVKDTFLVYRPMGKRQKVFFVIGLKNGQIKYFDIGNQLGFKYNEFDFADLIEHFKSKFFDQQCIAKGGS